MKKSATLTVMALTGLLTAPAVAAAESTARVELKHNESQGQLQILVDGKEALVYRYGNDVDMPHYYPVRSPSGQLLTVQQTDPYPHHRSIWFADTVQCKDQRVASFYNALYSRVNPKNPKSPFRDRIRHVKFLAEDTTGAQAVVKEQLLWEADLGKTPMLDEMRELGIVPLGRGEYLLDMKFEVKAAYGDVTFRSDQTHYAWPYVRVASQISMAKGGTMTSSEGIISKHEIDGKGMYAKCAHWVDYSNTVGGVAEGLAIFATDMEAPHWLTRNYGTFGPRRPDAQSGTKFTLKKGDSLRQHVGILIHSGDVSTGRVSERYRQFVAGRLEKE
jgi:hypothetical protein